MTSSEASELAAVVLDRLSPRLPGVASSDSAATRPEHRLYELVAERLRTQGEQEALAELVRDPRNNSLVKRLLATAATEDPAYAEQLAAAVRALPAGATPAAPGDAAAPATGGPARSAAAESAAAESAAEDGAANGRRPRRYGPWVGLGAVVVLLLVGVFVARGIANGLTDAGGLTADSSCREYRQAPPEERVAAIRQIGLAKGIPGVDSPLVMTAVDQLCEAQPAAKLGDLVARFDG